MARAPTAIMGVPPWHRFAVGRGSMFAARASSRRRWTGPRRSCVCAGSGETREVVAFCASLPRLTPVVYEAGPTGFALARALAAAGIECVIAAPGTIERPPAIA